MKRFYTVKEAAASLGVGETWIYSEIRSDRLHSIKLQKKRLIPAADMDAYAALLIQEARS